MRTISSEEEIQFELNYQQPIPAPTLVPTTGMEKRLDFRLAFPTGHNLLQWKKKWAIHIHAFYMDEFKYIMDKLPRIPGNCRVLITTDTAAKKHEVDKLLKGKNCLANAESIAIIETSNLGRNIYPLLFEVLDRVFDCEYALHLHTKRSTHAALGGKWSRDILNCLIGSEEQIKAIRSCFLGNPNLGLIIPRPYATIKPFTSWGDNFEPASRLLALAHPNKQLSIFSPLVFPAGMMLWFRPGALAELKNCIKLSNKTLQEPLPTDGTVLHAAERIVIHLAELDSFQWALSHPEEELEAVYKATPANFSVWQENQSAYLTATSAMAKHLLDKEKMGPGLASKNSLISTWQKAKQALRKPFKAGAELT
jgi:lipopolysaccharide biosynthesis protein